MVVGLFGALIGGGLRGYAEGEAEKVKAQRDMQLQQLQNQFLGEQGNLNRAVQIDATKQQGELTRAQIAANERMADLASRTSLTQTGMTTTASKDINAANVALGKEQLAAEIDKYKAQIASNEKTAGEQLAGQKEIAGSQIAAQKDIVAFQAEAAQKLGITEKLDAKGKVILLRPDGTKVDLPKDENGKEIDLASPDASTPEMKNLAALMLIPGMTQQKAVDYIYGAKADSPTSIQMSFFEAMSKSKPFGTTTEDLQNWMTLSGQFRDQVIAAREAAAAAPPAAAPGAAPGATPAPAAGAPTSASALPAGVMPMPATEAELVVNNVYPLPNGEFGKWNGRAFVTVPAPAAAPASGSPPRG